jgi:hypothetical protein
MTTIVPARTAHAPQPTRSRGGVMAGCLIALVVVIVIVAAGCIFVWMNWRGWTASGVQSATVAVMAKSGLPQDQQDQINAEVKSLTDDFRAGKISVTQMKDVGDQIIHSPLVPLASLQAARQKYIEPSTMTPEEKDAANRSLQRFARGVYEQKIAPAQPAIDDVVKPIVRLKPDGKWELKDKPTRQELDQFVANCKQKADDAKIPDEPYDLNIAEELKKAIDKALGRA